MKKILNVLILTLIIMLCSSLGAKVLAADATAILNLSKTKAQRGDTFTVTLNISCEEGINGLEGTLSYDISKLELVKTEIVDTSKWVNLGDELNFSIIHSVSDTIKSANIVKATFKVKDTAVVGTAAKITMSNIKVDSDAATDSIKTIGTKEVEIAIIEELNVNISGYTTEQEETNKYIRKISPKTTVAEMKERISTNGTIEIYKGTTKISAATTKLGTGMEVRISLNGENDTYKVVITGDTSGDGEADFSDILAINKHRLGKANLEGEYLKAGDVTGDGKADFSDILQINKYRLGRISSL